MSDYPSHYLCNIFCVIFFVSSSLLSSYADDLPGPDQTKIETFLLKQGYKNWAKQPAHLSGANVAANQKEHLNYTVHGFIEVYYSSGVEKWIKATPPKLVYGPNALKAGEMIIAVEYFPTPEGKQGELHRIHSMVKNKGRQAQGSYDGWFWSTTYFKGASQDLSVDHKRSSGKFGRSECIACHAAANNDGMVFLSKNGPLTPANSISLADWKPSSEMIWSEPPEPKRKRLKPLPAADSEFLKYYDLPDIKTAIPFPNRSLDHVFPGNYAGMSRKEKELYITSSQCIGCHNAAQLLTNTRPNMWYAEPDPTTTLVDGESTPDSKVMRNFSPYGEWSASLNALSGRDPVWHAQVDFERKLRPELAQFTTDACFSCHGPMAGRQLKTDKGLDQLFTIDQFYATTSQQDSKYGALARDGVSCAVCHQIPAKNLGEDPQFLPRDRQNPGRGFFVPADLKSYSAMFDNPPTFDNPVIPTGAYFGPYKNSDILSNPMEKGLGQKAAHGPDLNSVKPQIREAKLCGTCHTVLVPALPVGYVPPVKGSFIPGNQFGLPAETKMSFEQTTYLEWRNSRFENERKPINRNGITCQNCHMSSHHDSKSRMIVNMETGLFPPVRDRVDKSRLTFKKKLPIYRHVLLGINLFVFEMFEQFPGLLGNSPTDSRVPEKTLDPVLNARDWIENHAKKITADVRITSVENTDIVDDIVVAGNKYLETEVQVTNFAGHKFPTGAGFRRAFLQFEVLDENEKILWASGRLSPLGVLLSSDGRPLRSEETRNPEESQPHHQIITEQEQVQIYETRALDSEVKLQTTVLGIYYEYKDNRILPLGYTPPSEASSVTQKATGSVLVGAPSQQPIGLEMAQAHVSKEALHHPTVIDGEDTPRFHVVYDPDYWSPEHARNGKDRIRYRVPLDKIQGWKKIKAQLYYQTIPPYYLRDRFETGIPEGEKIAGLKEVPPGHEITESDRIRLRDKHRLIHIASRLNLKKTPAENWCLKINDAAIVTRNDSGEIVGTKSPLNYGQAWDELKRHYNYLDLK